MSTYPPHQFEESEFMVGGCGVCGDRPKDDPIHTAHVTHVPNHRNPFRDAIEDVMTDKHFLAEYPEGLNSCDVLLEVRARHPGQFTLCSAIDAADELKALYGSPEDFREAMGYVDRLSK